MADSGLDLMTGGPSEPGGHGRRRAETPRRKPWGRRILVLVIVLAIAFGGYAAYGKVSDMFGGPADYSGQGTAKVTVEVPKGADGQQIANILKKAGVVETAEAFYQLALKDSRFQSVQAGFYQLRREMSSEAALTALIDKGNRIEGKVTIPEGSRVGQIVKLIAAGSKIKQPDLLAALDKPESLGLPKVANLNPEGYLFPATYTVVPGTTATELLRQMVKKTLDVAKSLDIGTRAKALGLTGEQIITVASILEYEAKKDADYPKVARVLYNRLDAGMALQLDSTVSYVSNRKGDVFTTPKERADPSKYNTYQNPGLPPGPIGSPGEKTIEAALNPADGSWLYFVAVNLDTGETIFSNTFAEHNVAVAKLQEYCKTSDAC
ncbi:endolytic transglycosylase MltG [Aeromicrobium sp.]|uniref:endolytic transglycosylase MltG n=1 Tax=Aeromicrobium sp. TaxID=1871063 RepID=UPI001983C981|nr:endolytic transglycosylase MltG [Aeromicrobium sp.]MBC7633172.1 endolytic transglycosylase MltG [Aeromicrobium sp.]